LGNNGKRIVQQLLWIAAPYGIYFTYLFLTHSWQDFYFANVIYNTQHYISLPNYVKGNHFNPLKFSLTLLYNFIGNYFALLAKIPETNLYLPIGALAALGSFVLAILLVNFNVIIGVLYLLTLVFSAPRSNIQIVQETDYQGSLFLVLGVIASLLVLYLIQKIQKIQEGNLLKRDLLRLAQVILTIFLIFSGGCLIKNSYEKYFQRLTQKMPSIYDFSYTAQFIDSLLNHGEYYWIGPYEPQEIFYVTKGQLAGKYPSLLPQFRENAYLKQDFLKQMESHPPKIIIYRHEASIFSTPALEFGQFFLNWMQGKYIALENLKGVTILKSPSSFVLASDLYIRLDKLNEVLSLLQENGYIQSGYSR